MKATSAEIARWTGGRLVGGNVSVAGVSHDSRMLNPGALFVALPGEQRDGHEFVPAIASRAGAVLVSREMAVDVPQIVVSDTLQALQEMARQWLLSLDLRVVALTGSNGKTTTKSLIAAILRRVARVHATPGNYNNEIGVPLTVLGFSREHQYGVVEMGCGKPGDIDELTRIAPPDAALVTNIAPAHLERLGTLEGVAQAKAGIYRGLRGEGVAVINADDAFADYFRAQAGRLPVIDYAIDAPAAVRAESLQLGLRSRFRLVTPSGSEAIELPLPGRHNVMNALAAASLALAVDVPLSAIAGALAQVEAVAGRQRRMQVRGGVLYDDSYNANPGSLSAAIETLGLEATPRWLVLGDMAELGAEGISLHARCGALARARGIERLYAIGPLSAATVEAFGSNARHFTRMEDLIAAVLQDWEPRVTALVKGSRSAGMERVVSALAAAPVETH